MVFLFRLVDCEFSTSEPFFLLYNKTSSFARPLRRAVQSQLEDKLAEALLNGEIKRGDHVEAGISKKEIKFTVREINS